MGSNIDKESNESNNKRFELLYQNAAAMHKNEHTRWNSWALLYLGVIATVFYSIDKLPKSIPVFVPLFFAAFVSGLWIFVNLNIKMSTTAWHETLQEMENPNAVLPFQFQKQEFENNRRCQVFCSSLGMKCYIEGGKSGRHRKSFIYSVTACLLMLSTVMTILFLLLGAWQFVQFFSKDFLLNEHQHKGIYIDWTSGRFLFPVIFIPQYVIARVIKCCKCKRCRNEKLNTNNEDKQKEIPKEKLEPQIN